jgi:7-carboxy-7-deazaguanine synthase
MAAILPVMEQFYTIQGEGAFSGHAAYFIRLGGCDVGCVWCDVKDSWNAELHEKVTVEDIVLQAKQHPSRIAVITGGEPAMYNLTLLTSALKNEGFSVHIETSGAYPLLGQFDWITFSPKKFKAPLKEVSHLAHELKVVVYNKSDFEWAETHAKEVSDICKLYLQPEWDKHDKMLPLILSYIKDNPVWSVSLQTHKFMNIP